jgi:hypothetical protein
LEVDEDARARYAILNQRMPPCEVHVRGRPAIRRSRCLERNRVVQRSLKAEERTVRR